MKMVDAHEHPCLLPVHAPPELVEEQEATIFDRHQEQIRQSWYVS